MSAATTKRRRTARRHREDDQYQEDLHAQRESAPRDAYGAEDEEDGEDRYDPLSKAHYHIADDEWIALYDKLGKLCYFAARDIAKSNRVAHDPEQVEELGQESFYALLRSCLYYKRQCFIQQAFCWLNRNGDALLIDDLARLMSLVNRWAWRQRNGGKRGFRNGDDELAEILDNAREVAGDPKPVRNAMLVMDNAFMCYAKANIWRAVKTAGAKIAEQKKRAAMQVSLSDCDFLDRDMQGTMNDMCSREQLNAMVRQSRLTGDPRTGDVLQTLINAGEDALVDGGTRVNKALLRRAQRMANTTVTTHLEELRRLVIDSGGISQCDFTRISVKRRVFEDAHDGRTIHGINDIVDVIK